MNAADFAATSPWDGLHEKPDLFPPEEHKHELKDLAPSGALPGDMAVFNGKEWVPSSAGKIEVTSKNGSATLEETLRLIADEAQSLAEKTLKLEALFDGNVASFEQRITAISSANAASVTEFKKLTAIVGAARAEITRVDEVTANRTSAAAKATVELKALFEKNSATLSQTLSTFASKTSVQASKIEAIKVAAAYTDTMSAVVSGGWVAAVDAVDARVDVTDGNVTALGVRTTTLEAQVNTPTTGILARISTVETTKADSSTVTALATRTSALESSVDTAGTGLLARVSTIESTYATSSGVTASIATAISTEVTNRNAAISASASSITTAYSSADTAIVSSVTALTATVNLKITTYRQGSAPSSPNTGDIWIDTSDGNSMKRWSGSAWVDTTIASGAISAAVSAEASVRAGADGFLEGKYTLKVAAGDVVTGMNITSSTGAGTDTSEVTFNTSVFKIFDGTSGVAPFTVAGGIVTIGTELDVGTSLNRTRITTGGLTVGGGSFASAFIGTPDSGSTSQIRTSSTTGEYAAFVGSAGGVALSIGNGSGQQASINGSGIASFKATTINGQLECLGVVDLNGNDILGCDLLSCNSINTNTVDANGNINTDTGITFGGGNAFRFVWTGSVVEVWVDVTHVGDMVLV